uniref:Glycosyltransferase 2-like domain-containing protein n=1 Tax=Meloidogyne javanica TaxID=6303 RepID=A0A915MQY6_MELJA
ISMKHKRKLRLIFRYLPRRLLYTFIYAVFIVFLIYFYKTVTVERVKIRENSQKFADLADGVDPFLSYRSLTKKDWLDKSFYEREQKREGNGEVGKGFIVKKENNQTLEKILDTLYRANGYNAYVSDHIALDRSVKDIRHPGCKTKTYIERLPSVSHYSTLLRSGYSIINRSPSDVLKEIIFVDDSSTKPELKEPFEQHWKAKNLDNIVKIVRTSKREGLIRARAIGARAANAEIIIFLDAHSEANYNWLPPLIEPIALNYRTVVCPFVDV